MRNSDNSDIDIVKAIVILSLLTSIFVFSSIVISAYPQHLYLGKDSVIESVVGNFDNGTVNVRGNQVQYVSGDVIPLEGRENIRITGNQVQIGGSTLIGAIRTVTSELHQNILFEKPIGVFPIQNAGRILVDDVEIILIPVTDKIINIRTLESNYNVEFINDVTYITSKDVMVKIMKSNDTINIYLIGTKSYQNVIFVKL